MNVNNKMVNNLTSGEVSSLWMSYQYETLNRCGINFFLQHVDDCSIQEILQNALSLTNKRIEQITELFMKYSQLLPKVFSIESDVNLQAPRLFSDKLYLFYIMNTAQLELVTYMLSMREAMNNDVLTYYHSVIKDSLRMELETKHLTKEKGLHIPSPQIPPQKHNEIVKQENFLAGWFGNKRPLLGTEIAQLVMHAKRNALGQAVITAFSQVARAKEIRKYFARGREIAGKHLAVFTEKLHDDYLPTSSLLLTSEVTESTDSPFSDKLMTVFINKLISIGIGGYGFSLSLSPRRDLAVDYSRLMSEIATYSDDGAELLIKNGWMEQPPMAADRKDLAK